MRCAFSLSKSCRLRLRDWLTENANAYQSCVLVLARSGRATGLRQTHHLPAHTEKESCAPGLVGPAPIYLLAASEMEHQQHLTHNLVHAHCPMRVSHSCTCTLRVEHALCKRLDRAPAAGSGCRWLLLQPAPLLISPGVWTVLRKSGPLALLLTRGRPDWRTCSRQDL